MELDKILNWTVLGYWYFQSFNKIGLLSYQSTSDTKVEWKSMLDKGGIAHSFFYGNYELCRTSSFICFGKLRLPVSYNYVDL